MRKAKTAKEIQHDLIVAEQMTKDSDAPNCKCQATPEPVKAIRPGNTQLVGAVYNDKPEPRENDAITTYYKFIKFVMVEQKPKTKVYEVYNTRYGALLGVVKWYGPWRRYCFWPQGGCIFSAKCMEDVAQFINNRTD